MDEAAEVRLIIFREFMSFLKVFPETTFFDKDLSTLSLSEAMDKMSNFVMKGETEGVEDATE